MTTHSNSTQTVLHVVTEARGGICRHTVELCKQLPLHGWDCAVMGPEGSLARMIEFGLPATTQRLITPENLPPPFQSIATALQIRHHAQGRFQIIHAHGYKAALMTCVARVKPVVITAHNEPPSRGRLLIRMALQSSAAIAAISNVVADQLTRMGVDPQKMCVIPNGVTVTPLPSFEERMLYRQALLTSMRAKFRNLPDAVGPIIVGIGRLSVEKGFDLLIQAFGDLLTQNPEALMVIVGGGPERKRLEKDAEFKFCSRVVFTGEQPVSEPFIRGADIVVIPSRKEGQSLVALESLACGIRTVATHVGGLPEMIQPLQTGWLCSPEDPESLLASMQEALAAPPDKFAQTGHDTVAQQYDPHRLLNRLLNLYHQTADLQTNL